MGIFNFWGKKGEESINADMGKDSWGENANTGDFGSIWQGAQKGLNNTFDAAMLTALQQRQRNDEYQVKQLAQIKKKKEESLVLEASRRSAIANRIPDAKIKTEIPDEVYSVVTWFNKNKEMYNTIMEDKYKLQQNNEELRIIVDELSRNGSISKKEFDSITKTIYKKIDKEESKAKIKWQYRLRLGTFMWG